MYNAAGIVRKKPARSSASQSLIAIYGGYCPHFLRGRITPTCRQDSPPIIELMGLVCSKTSLCSVVVRVTQQGLVMGYEQSINDGYFVASVVPPDAGTVDCVQV